MKRYGLIGRTLTHSFSKTYFAGKFAEEGITGCIYENYELETIDAFPALLSSTPDLKGLNVTIPYKEEIIRYLSAKDETLAAIGACNCIKVEGDSLTGYNTDAIGFRKSLEPQLMPHHTKALILGTGGASKAVRYVLEQLGIEYAFVSRQQAPGQFTYDELDERQLADYHLVINTTPLGMYPKIDVAPSIPYHSLTSRHFLFDLIYNPEKTKFLQEGEKRGAKVCNGYQMLIEQAEAAWRIWNKRKG